MCSINWIAISALATTAMVIISFVVFFRPTFRRPKFSIDYGAGLPFCRQTTSSKFSTPSAAVPMHWIRLRVRNTGRSVAKHCLGKITKIMDDEGQENDKFDLMLLHWVGTGWHDVPFQTLDQNRGEFAYLDILATQSKNRDIYLAGDQFPWAKYERRQILDHLSPGKYILSISVYGDDINPKTKYVSLIWGGSGITDVKLELHDNLGKAKRWLKKRELTSVIDQPDLDTIKHERRSGLMEKYAMSQVPTYFFFGLILLLLNDWLLKLVACVALLMTIILSLVAFEVKFPKKALIMKHVQIYNVPFHILAWGCIFWISSVDITNRMISEGICFPIRIFVAVISLALLIVYFIHFIITLRREQSVEIDTA